MVLAPRRWVWLFVVAGLGFHAGIYATMRIFFVELVATYVVFVDWSALRDTLRSHMPTRRLPAPATGKRT